MSKKVHRRLQAAKKKKSKKRISGRGIYKKLDGDTSSNSGTINLTSVVEVNPTQDKVLQKGLRKVATIFRNKIVDLAFSRGDFKNFLGMGGHAFMETMRIRDRRSTESVAEEMVSMKLEMSAETKMGACVEAIAAEVLPLRKSKSWHVLDSDKDLKDNLVSALGSDFVKQLDLYGKHCDIGGGKILRLPGMKLNGATMNAATGAYASNSLFETDPITKLARAEGCARTEIIIGLAYAKANSQSKNILKKLTENLEPLGWKRIDEEVGHPCLISPNGKVRFRVLVGKQFWGYLADPSDGLTELDVMSMLACAQEKLPVKRGLHGTLKKLVVSMDDVFKRNSKAFLADPRYKWLVSKPLHIQKRMLWGNAMTGSFKFL